MVCLVHAEKTVLRVPKVELDPTESLALLVLLEKRVNLVCQGCQVIQGDKDLRAPAGFQASQGPMERKAPGELLGNLVQEVNEVQQVHVGPEVRGVPQGNQDQRAQQATTALLVHPERGDLKDLRDLLASPDQRGHLDHQERMDCPVTPDREEKPVSKERLVRLDLEV